MENTHGQMEEHTAGSGRKIICTAKVYIPGLTVEDMKVTI
jgi:hypothetical protein